MERMRREVSERFGVTLSPEVEMLGAAPGKAQK
jgi:UDP-N-acetylenolpyruvoylglucosamine reductase